MKNLHLIYEVLDRFSIPHSVLDNYNEPHRFYHNLSHIDKMIDDYFKNYDQHEYIDVMLAIIFHDIIYNPKNNDNEIQSASFLKKYVVNNKVFEAISDTASHIVSNTSNRVSQILQHLDTKILYDSTLSEFIEYDKKIFKEYQFVDYNKYKAKRVEFLTQSNVAQYKIEYVESFNPKIGLYAGSFNPFHIGHLNILQKAEAVFDKVIIAQGQNPDKKANEYELPVCLAYHQIEKYDGLLTDLVSKLNQDITLVRGLRNATDLQYEMNMYSFLQDLSPSIKIVSFFSDIEYNHISSSAIKNLEKYHKHTKYLC